MVLFFFTISLSFACEGEYQGSGIIEMKEDESICITIMPVGQVSETKCFKKEPRNTTKYMKE